MHASKSSRLSAVAGRPAFPAVLRLLLCAASLGLLARPARAQDNQLEVDVRPSITDKDNIYAHTTKTPDEGGHSKIYGILSVQEIKAEERLIKPVNEGEIMELLSRELNANGFKLYAPGTKPEIVLTVSYGRGVLQNPYMKGSTGISGASSAPIGNGSMSTSDGVTTSTIEGAFATQIIDEKTPGFQSNLQKASFEKLFIRVTAWTYPSAKTKSKMLWKTTMVVDDPDHRDLNAVAQKMLEAGVPFFDKQIRERDALVYKPLPDGHVNVGAPEVVAPKSK